MNYFKSLKQRSFFMKEYLRLFLTTMFVTFVLNVAQAQDTDVNSLDIESPEKNVIPENIIQAHDAVWEVKPRGGTAFFIGPNQVVTNFHVITGYGESYKSRAIEDMYLEQGDTKIKFKQVLYVSAVEGLAILETEEEVSEFLNISKEYPSGGLFALGYPLGVKETLIHSEDYEVIDNGYDYNMAVDKIDLGDLKLLEGLRGSSVLNEQKEVVGIVLYSYDNMLGVIKVSKLEDLLGGVIGLDCSSKDTLSFCIEQAVKDITEKAESGDSQAQYRLGVMLYNGKGVEKNQEKAVEWWLKSAKNDFAPALYAVSLIMYSYGIGVEQPDDKKAYKLMSKSEKQGFAPAKIRLAIMYYNGKGVDKNRKKASELMSEVANQGRHFVQQWLNKH